MRTDYGTLPDDLGLIDLNPVEMMAWLYCPISLAGSIIVKVPPNLNQYNDIFCAVLDDLGVDVWRDKYIYVTAKTLFVTPESPGNRPGWHSDGFMTDDLNYIWSDRNPTLFWEAPRPTAITQNHVQAMEAMTYWADHLGRKVTFPDRHLLRLDERHIHRVGDITEAGMRTFVKVSVSDHLYAHVGNSINHDLDYPRPSVVRSVERNCPATN